VSRTGPYAAVLGAGVRTEAAYRSSLVATAVGTALSVTVLASVWSAVFDARGGRPAAGFTEPDLILYLVAANLLAVALRNEADVRLAGEVYRGDHVTGMVRPVGYLGTHAALGAAVVLVRVGLVAVPLALPAVLLLDLRAPAPGDLLLGLVSAVLAAGLAITANLLVGMAGFVTTNTWGVRYLYTTLAAGLSGQLIPLDLIPDRLRPGIEALPFASMVHTPTTLLLGRYDGAGGALLLLAVQVGWLAALALAARVAWRGATRVGTVAGG
jgi:ABC-2 type transport system permease protein